MLIATAAVAPDTAAALWRDYATPWTAWNQLRTAAATLALTAFGVAAGLALLRTQPRPAHGVSTRRDPG